MHRIFVIIAVLMTSCAYGQSITVTYNSQQLLTGTPYAPPYEYSYGQTIYLENDIQGSGIITSLTFYYNGTHISNSDSITVYLGLTSVDHLDSIKAFKSTTLSQVFQGTLSNYTIPGPIIIPLQTPFIYNGDSNLVVAINETKAGTDTFFSNQFLGYYPDGHNRGLAWGNTQPWPLSFFDLTPGAFPSSGGGVPIITFIGLTHFACRSPRLVRFSNITHDSARIRWSPPDSGNTPTSYDIYYSTSRYKPPSSIITPYTSTDTMYKAIGLNFSTWYYAWVRTRAASCTSVWTVVDSFKTLCAPVATPTPPEPFNKPFPPNCWERARGFLSSPTQFLPQGTQHWIGAPYRHIAGSDSAAKAYITSDTLNHWLISPPYDLGTSGNKSLEFDAAFTKNGSQNQGSFDADDKFMVVISTDEGQTWSSANVLRTWASPQTISAAGVHFILPLTAYSGIVRIGFYVQSTSGTPVGGNIPTLFIDNVKISEILPVTLLDFTGKKEGTINLLNWRTATEQNNKGFELQRSISGTDFSTIAFVPTKAREGNSTSVISYNYADNKPFAGNNYYRLKQIDKDGKATLSNVVLIKGNAAEQLVISALYPNPVRQTLNVLLNAPAAQKVQLLITDMVGKLVQQQTMQLQKGDNNKTLNAAGLQKGSYIIKVVCNNGCEAAVSKFVKE